jgi:hypothetical protein
MSIASLIKPVGKGITMKRYRVYYIDEVQANSEEEAYEQTLQYLHDCIWFQDVSAFNYEYIGDVEEAKVNKEFFNRITNNLLGEKNA